MIRRGVTSSQLLQSTYENPDVRDIHSKNFNVSKFLCTPIIKNHSVEYLPETRDITNSVYIEDLDNKQANNNNYLS